MFQGCLFTEHWEAEEAESSGDGGGRKFTHNVLTDVDEPGTGYLI